MKFSLHVEPDNEATKSKLDWAIAQRQSNKRTIPSTIKEELTFNPFMRIDIDSMKKRFNTSDPISCMADLRKMKDSWKP